MVVLLHGGFWKAMYTKGLMTQLAADIIDRGWAAWNVEYRRVGTFPSGGWPGTFEDVASAIDHLAVLAGDYGLDVTRVVTVGHSAGGHLSLWAAARGKLPADTHGALDDRGVALRGAIGLAPVADLAEAALLNLGGGAVQRFLGGSPEKHPDRYALANPAALLPLGVPQVLMHGSLDGAVPLSLSQHYVERAVSSGDEATLVTLPGVGHMELIDPASSAWAETVVHLHRLLA